MDAFLFDADEPDAPEAKPRLPSLATLLRYRRQVAREMEEAGGNLHRLIDGRLGRAGGTDEPGAGGEEDEETDEADADGRDDDEADAASCTDEPAPEAAGAGLPGPVFPDPRRDSIFSCRARISISALRFTS